MKKIARAEAVDLREVWKDEARDFTPWLASVEGLSLLNDELGVELVGVEIEQNVGPYKADIVAKVASIGDEEKRVVIENQLDQTDHDHLGKIITYAAGQEASIVVWVARNFIAEHRQAIDWLNENMPDVDLFGLEIALFKIEDSPPAPQFKVISSPNEWSKKIRASRASELSETELQHLKYWEELRNYAVEKSKGDIFSQKARAAHEYYIAIGRSNFEIKLWINSRIKEIGAYLHLFEFTAKIAFDQIFANKEEIEDEIGYALQWHREENKKTSWIALKREGFYQDENIRQELIEWHFQKALDLHRVFSKRVRDLKLE